MSYDPIAYGCLCDECPLNKDRVESLLNDEDKEVKNIVPPEIREGKPLVIGEAPGNWENKLKRPFVGPSGKELERALHLAGKSRKDASLTNSLLCRPKGGDLLFYLRKLSKRNKEKAKKAKEKKEEFTPTKNPLDCCYPRLQKEIEAAPSVIMLGATAMRQAKGDHAGEEGVKRTRGFVDTLADGKKCIATWHPAFVLRSRRWTETFRSDIAKAFRYFENRLNWKEPKLVFDPDTKEAEAALKKLKEMGKWIAVDTETDGLDPDLVNLRCVGVSNDEFGVVFGLTSVESPKRTFKIGGTKIKELLNSFFLDKSLKICGHNINLYDRPILDRHGIFLPPMDRCFDTVVLHHISDSELPHDLGFLSSRYTDFPKHKPEDHDAWKSDEELQKYCLYDTSITSSLVEPLGKEVGQTNQTDVYYSDIKLQELCRGMHTAGMLIDPVERRRHEERLRLQVEEAKEKANKLIGREINLFSPDQVRDYLFDDLSLPIPSFITDSGEPSTNKDSMYEVLQMAISDKARDFIHILLDARQAGRALAKDVMGLNIRRETERVHSTWNPTSVVTGRLSSSNPNVANVPSTKLDLDSLRSMYIADEGNVLVSSDLEQVELRLVSLLSGDDLWLGAFEKELDVHKVNAATFFGIDYNLVEKYQRDFSKGICYMYLYQGGPNKALLQMRQVRNPVTKERPYANLTLMQAKAARNKLLEDHPKLVEWWNRTIEEFHSKYYLDSMLLKRRRKFLDSIAADEEGISEIINFRIQSSTADLMNLASAKLIDSIGWNKIGPGIINQCHDSLMVEVKENKAEEAAKLLEEAMSRDLEYEGRKIRIPAKAKIGKRWSNV